MAELHRSESETKKLIEQSDELWQKINYKEVKEALAILKKNITAMRTAVEFDSEHPHVNAINPMAHGEDVSILKRAENGIDELVFALEF